MTSSNVKTGVNDFFRKNVPIDWYLPIKLSNGSEVHSATCRCLRCGGLIKDGNLKGSIHRSIKGFRITAFGLCEECNLMTPHMYDIVPDGDTFSLVQHKWNGWGEGEVVTVDFVRKKKIDD